MPADVNLSRALVVVGVVTLAAVTAEAQWVMVKTAGLPRTPDGKPDLNAPAARVWQA
jgi:hypothetical protein